MTIKNLFEQPKNPIINQSLDDFGGTIESASYVVEYQEWRDRFVPDIDYSSASNFAHFALAEKYYDDAIAWICGDYPYDGSRQEKLEWHNKSSDLENYLFENEYPRQNGYIIMSYGGWGTLAASADGYGLPSSPEYIALKGGPHTGPANNHIGANVYDANKKRVSNLHYDLVNDGVTVEFWLKKSAFDVVKTGREVIFDLWNGVPYTSPSYGRLTIELTASAPMFRITAMSGTDGMFYESIGSGTLASSGSDWRHYAFTFANTGSNIRSRLYVNGELNHTIVTGSVITEVTGALSAYIGALHTAISGGTATTGYGKLSASVDEFRYWKTVRTAQDIGRFWFTQVAGGANTEDTNVDLGVYYKFNEGIYGTSTYDANVLDYSGRLTNGVWTGYAFGARNTGSAMVEADAAESEFQDPIVYSTHADVKSLRTVLVDSGYEHDSTNNAALYNHMPAFLLDEDKDGEALRLTQMLGTYFDKLFHLINAASSLRHVRYRQDDEKQLPFIRQLLQSAGMHAPEIFIDTEIFELLGSRDEDREFEQKLHNIKNTIYQNIYNNLVGIYKSKGTEKSFRNLIRCFGVDDELIRLNIYGDNVEYELEDSFRSTAIGKHCINFNHPDRFTGTVYQTIDTTNVNSTLSYIPALTSSTAPPVYPPIPRTVEAEIIFPHKVPHESTSYFETSFLTSSLFGIHTAQADPNDYTWSLAGINFTIVALRSTLDSTSVKFAISGSGGMFTSSLFPNVYDNTKWNLAMRILPPAFSDQISGSTGGQYTFELYGVNMVLDSIQHEFVISFEIPYAPASGIFNVPQRIFAGAHYENFTGSLLQHSDVKLTSLRAWLDYLSDDEIKMHARDSENYGRTHPYRPAYTFKTAVDEVFVPRADTLMLDWQFADIVSSASFIVNDFSSGSTALQGQYSSWLGNLLKRQYSGRGRFFATNDNVVTKEYLFTARQQPPENLYGTNMINVLTDNEQEIFTPSSRPIRHYYALEKSMHQTISKEMLQMFAGIVDFNNLIGEPVNRYRMSYKAMEKLRQLFFARVSNTANLDKYVEYYKWLDSAISKFVEQIIPASANMSSDIATVVESHVLERNKYQSKFPTLEMRRTRPTGELRGINELLYDWKFGHATASEASNCFWWKERAERIGTTRERIHDVTLETLERGFSTPYHFEMEQPHIYHGGVNYGNKIRGYVQTTTEPFGPYLVTASYPSFPLNVLMMFGSDVEAIVSCSDVYSPTRKQKRTFRVVNFREWYSTASSYADGAGDLLVPFSMYSSSVRSGYNKLINDGYHEGCDFANLHSDTYIHSIEVPMQGPFTEQHVGGHQHCHVPLNMGADDVHTRPEAWYLLISDSASLLSGAIPGAGFVESTYPHWPSTSSHFYNVDRPRARYYRNEMAKRPVNIANVRTISSSRTIAGNFSYNYEVAHIGSRTANNFWFRDSPELVAPHPEVFTLRSDITDGHFDHTLPQRSKTLSVFVSRFSAPGGMEVQSRGYLEPTGEELSAYNALPFRNTSVLFPSGNTEVMPGRVVPQPDIHTRGDGLHTLHTRHCGQFGIDSVLGAIQPLSYDTVASYHKVNRNRLRRLAYTSGTAVVTASTYDNFNVIHPMPRSDLQYSWITSSLQSALVLGRFPPDGYISTSLGLVPAFNIVSASQVANLGVVETFTNMASLVYDPLDTASLTLNGAVLTPLGAGLGEAETFNALMLHRNGPYQHPTWKQIRGGEHQTARHMRYNNQICLEDAPETTLAIDSGKSVRLLRPIHATTTTCYTEPPWRSKFYPIKHVVKTHKHIVPLQFKYEYGNDLYMFANKELEERLGATKCDEETKYREILDWYMGPEPTVDFMGLRYKEIIYPKGSNMYLGDVRSRQNFANNFWRTSRQDRDQVSASNSQNNIIDKSSMWPLDARLDFNGPTLIPTDTLRGQYGEGELQNDYTRFHMGDTATIKAGAEYCRRWPTYEGGQWVYGGDSLWEAATQAGKDPFDSTYAEWHEVARSKFKSYTVVPEFRISEHMEHYVNTEKGNFLADNEAVLSLTGSSINDSSTGSFFMVYSHSDFMKHFRVLKHDHQDIAIPAEITLSCNAVMKFLPYDGFYPVNRTTQLATLFSASYMQPVLKAVLGGQILYTTPQYYRQMLLNIFFAPGLMYNTIKSGLAVDYPFHNENTWNKIDVDLGGGYIVPVLSGSTVEGPGDHVFTQRAPFEALLQPNSLVGQSDILLPNAILHIGNSEPHPSASHNGVQSWLYNGGSVCYSLAMHNFLAEIPNFFLDGQKLTTMVSAPNALVASQRPHYEMEVVVVRGPLGLVSPAMARNDSIKMYERASAFGPPVFCWRGVAPTADYSFAPFTPPYFDGWAAANFSFKPQLGQTYTIKDIMQHITASYSRVVGAEGAWTAVTDPYSPATVDAMGISASFNLLQLVDIKPVQYEALTGNPISVDTKDTIQAWAIQTKFETPILDFVNSPITVPNFGLRSVGRGMWHQYGDIINTVENGVYVFLRDTNTLTDALTGSLIDLCGFDRRPQQLGKIAKEKKISEAVVAVPFMVKDGDLNFFTLPRAQITAAQDTLKGRASKLATPSIVHMVDIMQRYVFPPQMNFLTYDSIAPFAMYIFEFEHVLSQQDLADIWQNLPPRLGGQGTKAVEFATAEASISHPLLAGELLGAGDQLNDHIRWMVFKVKRKANWNYYKLTLDSRDDERFKFDFQLGRQDSEKGKEPDYSYNWPYDYFSLVELAQIEAEVEFGNADSKFNLEDLAAERKDKQAQQMQEKKVEDAKAEQRASSDAAKEAAAVMAAVAEGIDEPKPARTEEVEKAVKEVAAEYLKQTAEKLKQPKEAQTAKSASTTQEQKQESEAGRAAGRGPDMSSLPPDAEPGPLSKPPRTPKVEQAVKEAAAEYIKQVEEKLKPPRQAQKAKSASATQEQKQESEAGRAAGRGPDMSSLPPDETGEIKETSYNTLFGKF